MNDGQVIALIAGILAASDYTYRETNFPAACVDDAERIVACALYGAPESEVEEDEDWTPEDEQGEGD